MQLNPSTDFYDDDEEEEEDDEDDEDDGFYDEADEATDGGTDGDEPEVLPEAKSLVAEPAKRSYAGAADADDEEIDMGYDEDDERYAAVERPKLARPSSDSFMNEEGSGRPTLTVTGYHPGPRDGLRIEHVDRYWHKQPRLPSAGDGVDAREGSGNFANDDEDGNDDDDDDDRDAAGVGGDADDAAADDDDDGANGGFFGEKRPKGVAGGGNRRRYFRKNTNDAIKIISTPLGKVGIVYQQTPNQEDDLQLRGGEEPGAPPKKASSSFTDFDALSPDLESSHRLASSHPKITPVLTADGKVALLYRGDSENSKYEPIPNSGHGFNGAKSNGTTRAGGGEKQFTSGSDEDDPDDSSDSEGDTSRDTSDSGFEGQVNSPTRSGGEHIEAKIIDDPDFEGGPDGVAPTTGSFIIRPTDSVLPMINRPLSEVLGIKKNQFKQFRIKDQPTTTPNPLRHFIGLAGGSAHDPHQPQPVQPSHTDSTTLHFLTKVNLADYPTSARTRNFDFDFSQDNTMLDERTRHPPHGEHDTQTAQTQAGTIANEEILSKTEVVNLAIVPHFDEDLERLQQLHNHESRRRLRQRHRQRPSEEDLSGTHCIMQAMMGIAAISTVFGMLGTFFKQRILDQIRLMHW